MRLHSALSSHSLLSCISSTAGSPHLINESWNDSLHLFLGLPLSLLPSGIHSHRFLASLSSCILSRCPHHLILATSILLTIGVTPTSLLTLSFLILSFLVFPIIALNIFISVACILLSCLLVCLLYTSPSPRDS